MSHEPSMSHLAVSAVERHVNSARPHAPVVPGVPGTERGARMARTRGRAAAALRRIAAMIEPPAPPASRDVVLCPRWPR